MLEKSISPLGAALRFGVMVFGFIDMLLCVVYVVASILTNQINVNFVFLACVGMVFFAVAVQTIWEKLKSIGWYDQDD